MQLPRMATLVEDGGEAQMNIKRTHANGWKIDVFFQGCSTEEDGPLLFWEVTANHPNWSAYVRKFGTKEEALKVHSILLKAALDGELQEILENF